MNYDRTLALSDFYTYDEVSCHLDMSKSQFAEARQHLGLTQEELGQIVNQTSATIVSWEDPSYAFADGTSIPPAVLAMKIVMWMLNGYRPAKWPQRLADIRGE